MTARNQQMMILDTVLMDNDFHSHPSSLHRHQTKMGTMTTMRITPITRIRRLLVSRKTFPCHHGHCSLHRRRRIQLRSTIVSIQVKEFGRTTQKQMRMMGDHALSVQIPCQRVTGGIIERACEIALCRFYHRPQIGI